MKKLIKNFRNKVKARGIMGLLSLEGSFHSMDSDGTKLIAFDDFKKILKMILKLEMAEIDVKKLFSLFDKNNDAFINYEEFLRGIIREMNERRLFLVTAVFQKLLKSAKGAVTIEFLKSKALLLLF